jgi:hypothetical protein
MRRDRQRSLMVRAPCSSKRRRLGPFRCSAAFAAMDKGPQGAVGKFAAMPGSKMPCAGMRGLHSCRQLPTISDSRHYQNRHLMTTITGVARCNIDLAARWSSAGRDHTYPNASCHRQSEPATTTPNECLHHPRQRLLPLKRATTRSRAHCHRLLTPSASTKSP